MQKSVSHSSFCAFFFCFFFVLHFFTNHKKKNKMPTSDSFFKLNVPGWLNYAMTFTGITGLAGVVLLYMYQCKLIYPASFPEGSRQEASRISSLIIRLQINILLLGSKTL
jgi:hypothetical protein